MKVQQKATVTASVEARTNENRIRTLIVVAMVRTRSAARKNAPTYKSNRELRRAVPRKRVVYSVLDSEEDSSDDEGNNKAAPNRALSPPKRLKVTSLADHIRSLKSTGKVKKQVSSSLDVYPIAEKLDLDLDLDLDGNLDLDLDLDHQWIDKYTPKASDQVALHVKKLREVQNCLDDMINGNSDIRILILSGPAGASKSTVVKCLSEELLNKRYPQSKLSLIEFWNTDVPEERTVDQFAKFLGNVRYRTGKNTSVILVEDLPNVFHDSTRISFQNALNEWLNIGMALPPLVLCITECDFPNDGSSQGYNIDNNFVAETIIGKKVLSNARTKRIKFNPVNATLIKKTLNFIVNEERVLFNKIPQSEIKQNIQEHSKIGDIRSAISSFQNWSVWKFKNPDGAKYIEFGKESSIPLFHAVGKCIFGTKNEGEQLNTTMEIVLRDFITRPNILKLGLLENYSKFNKSEFDLETAANVVDNLSFCDLFASRDDEISLDCVIRGTRIYLNEVNPNKANFKSATLSFPREWKVNRLSAVIQNDIIDYVDSELKRHKVLRSFQDSNLYYGFFEPIINSQREFKKKSKLAYYTSINKKIPEELYSELVSDGVTSRLGGPLKEINSDGDLIAYNDIELGNSSYKRRILDDAPTPESDISEFTDDPIMDEDTDSDNKNNDDNENNTSHGAKGNTNDEDEFGNDTTFETDLVYVSQRPPALQRTASNVSVKPKNVEFINDFDDEYDDFGDSDF